MSYDIIKSIRVANDKVIVRAAANNVTPRDYSPQEAPSLTQIYREHGEQGLILEILREYENGNFQPYSNTTNKYVRAIDRLRVMDSYKEFDWRVSDKQQYERNNANRSNKRKEFDELLLKAYAYSEYHATKTRKRDLSNHHISI